MAKKSTFSTQEWIITSVVGVVAVVSLVMIFGGQGVGFFGPRMECTPGARMCTSDEYSDILLTCDSTGNWFGNRCAIGCDPIKNECKRPLTEKPYVPPKECTPAFEKDSYRCDAEAKNIVGTYTLGDCTTEEMLFIKCARGCRNAKCVANV